MAFFRPYRAIGYISSSVPISLQRLRTESHATVSVRKAWQVCNYSSLGINVRIGGAVIPNNKRIETSLQYIHGIGRTKAKQILCYLGMSNKKTNELTERELVSLRDEVSKYSIEGELRRDNRMAIERLKEIRCYRGTRHESGLPCRGQRTHTNRRTAAKRK